MEKRFSLDARKIFCGHLQCFLWGLNIPANVSAVSKQPGMLLPEHMHCFCLCYPVCFCGCIMCAVLRTRISSLRWDECQACTIIVCYTSSVQDCPIEVLSLLCPVGNAGRHSHFASHTKTRFVISCKFFCWNVTSVLTNTRTWQRKTMYCCDPSLDIFIPAWWKLLCLVFSKSRPGR